MLGWHLEGGGYAVDRTGTPDAISSPLSRFSCRPSDKLPSSASRSPKGSRARSPPRAHTHRLVLVLQATGGHIRHGRGRSGVLALRYSLPHNTKRASPRSRRAGTTQERRTGNGEKPALFRFRVARRKCRWGASPRARAASSRPSGWGRRIPVPESRDPPTLVPGTSCHFGLTAHTLPLPRAPASSIKGSSLPDETYTCLAPSFQPQRFSSRS